MRIRHLVWLSVLLAGCASIRDLSPEKAAARITSYDSYKEEACEIMSLYVAYYEAFAWEKATPYELLPPEEIMHMAAVFANRPEVSCRVKAGKFIYDIDGRAFADIARVLAPLQDMYARLGEGEAMTACDDCVLPDIAISNGYLVSYFRRAPFPALRKQHADGFAKLCTDPDALAANPAALAAHEGHAAKPGFFNPLYENHGGCETIWRKALGDAGKCSRFGYTHYLICPTGVWSSHADPAMPFSAYPGFTKTYSFAAGFVLALTDGRMDVYWLSAEDKLSHELVTLAAGENIETDDFDANGKSDINVGDVIVLSDAAGLGRRTTVQAFNNNVAAKEAAAKFAANIDTWKKLPLDQVEVLLVSNEFKNAALIERAADLSAAWLAESKAQQRALLEQTQIFWHALLWNTLVPKAKIDRSFWDAARDRTAPEGYTERQRELAELRKQGDAKALYDNCNSLRNDMKQIVDDLQALVSGAEAADVEVGAAWERYLHKTIPIGDVRTALAAAQKNAQALHLYLAGVCF